MPPPIFHFLAQASQSGDQTNWDKWLAIFAGLEFLLLLFQPVIGWWLSSITRRLKDGDEKFEKHIVALTDVGARLKRVEDDVSQAISGVRSTEMQGAQVEAVAQGSVQQLETKIERDFVRKAEFDKYREEARDQHGEVMGAINNIVRGRK